MVGLLFGNKSARICIMVLSSYLGDRFSHAMQILHSRYETKEFNPETEDIPRWRRRSGWLRAEEAYFVAKPRDYETHPLREGEKRNTSIFHQSMTMALAELADPVRKAEWSKRWHQQLQEPEPDAPIERKTGKHHIYLRLDRYVQSVIQRQLRKEAGVAN